MIITFISFPVSIPLSSLFNEREERRSFKEELDPAGSANSLLIPLMPLLVPAGT